MKIILHPERSAWADLTIRTSLDTYEDLERAVKPILRAVKRSGDAALRRYIYKYDKVRVKDFMVGAEEFEEAQSYVSEDLKKAIQQAKYNIAQFHMNQRVSNKKIETVEGVRCWQRSVGIRRVGLYVPSRHAPLFSTILMLGIPANIAGCGETILCSTPDREGRLHPIILYTAKLLNISKVFKVGGVQAIAAMAYGTESIPKVNKIFGPSNQYVTVAKQLVSKQDVAVDLPAGPSELLVLADESANPAFVAADLIANAEHVNNSQPMLLSSSEELVKKVLAEIKRQLPGSSRPESAAKDLEQAHAIVFQSNVEAIEFINMYAPETLSLAIQNAEAVSERIYNAGAIYIGHYTPESISYAAGPNNTLPTNGYAKAYSGLSLDSFVRKINCYDVTAQGLKNIGKHVEEIASAEDLMARKNAVSIRLTNSD
jgi:histidinol dehydrogenase